MMPSPQMPPLLVVLATCLFLVGDIAQARIHNLQLKNDTRKFFPLSTFGFYKGGILDVQLTSFQIVPHVDTLSFGFSLDKTISDAINSYRDSHQEKCLLKEGLPSQEDPSVSVIYFTMDLKNKKMSLRCSQQLQSLSIFKNGSEAQAWRDMQNKVVHEFPMNPSTRRRKRDWSDSSLIGSRKLLIKRDVEKEKKADTAKADKEESSKEEKLPHPDKKHKKLEDHPQNKNTPMSDHCKGYNFEIHQEEEKGPYSTGFAIFVAKEAEEGLYNLYFHNCPNYQDSAKVSVSFTLKITEDNNGNYLSAGEMPLPALYFTMAILFFLSGCFWVFILRKSKREDVFKIHYTMVVLVYLKALSLLFHGINYHFIQIKGMHIEAWAVLYYITHLLKGALLFITIVLIGTGWAFIKHILSEKDKKIFMIVIPLQVLANVAEIIMEESEEGEVEHSTWRKIFILVDLLCCGAILFPVVWSIRHLQEASQTDGKAAINLRKLKLFRHFYIMIVCYIYFARIIVYLLGITVPFPYEWLDDMFREMATFVFFVLTGYKFRPASNNPYFQVPLEEDDLEMDMVITQTGLTEGLTKISRTKGRGGFKTVEKVAEEEEEVDSAQLLRREDRSREMD